MKKLSPVPSAPAYLHTGHVQNTFKRFYFGIKCFSNFAKKEAEVPFSHLGCATVPNTTYSSFALSYQLHSKNNPVYTQHHAQDFAKGGASLNQKLIFFHRGQVNAKR